MKIRSKIKRPRNLIAKDLFTPKYRMRVEQSPSFVYNRAHEKQKLQKENDYI